MSRSSLVLLSANVSGSSDANERQLEVVSGPYAVTVDGEALCTDGASLVALHLVMGNAFVSWGPDGPTLNDWFAWDESVPVEYDYNTRNSADFHLVHDLDLPLTWEDQGLVDLDQSLNPVKLVEQELAEYVDNGGSVVDFLRTDDVWDTTFTVNAVVTCDTGADTFPGLDSREVVAYVFYHGDRNISAQPVAGGPGTITPDPPAPPPVITAPPLPTPPRPVPPATGTAPTRR